MHNGELRKQGIKVKLQEQPFQFLVTLLRHAGDAVTREELRQQLWPRDTFVDFEHGLNVAVKRLRDALGDSAENPVFIETVARRGYRFIAPVDGVPRTAAIEAAGIPVRSKSSLRRLWLGLAMFLLIFVSIVALILSVKENGKDYDVLFLCGLTVSLYKLTNNAQYPNIVADARSSLTKLRGMHADVLLASHGFWFNLEGKAGREREGAPNPFIDPDELGRHLTEMQNDLEQALQAQEGQR